MNNLARKVRFIDGKTGLAQSKIGIEQREIPAGMNKALVEGNQHEQGCCRGWGVAIMCPYESCLLECTRAELVHKTAGSLLSCSRKQYCSYWFSENQGSKGK